MIDKETGADVPAGHVRHEQASPGSAQRREEILAAAFQVLEEHGYRGASTLAIARRARTSKETLYNWFGSKQGLFAALVSSCAESMDAELARAAGRPDLPPFDVLYGLATALLHAATDGRPVTVTQVAISESRSSPEFGRILFDEIRCKLWLRFAAHLERWREAGLVVVDDTDAASEAFFGLVVGDLLLRRLLGIEQPTTPDEIERRARRATTQFLTLFAPASR